MSPSIAASSHAVSEPIAQESALPSRSEGGLDVAGGQRRHLVAGLAHFAAQRDGERADRLGHPIGGRVDVLLAAARPSLE